ncbi:MAG: hypothetical protein NUV80_02705 [Candidatus Berkelbacteria bacterium]|nr:hypothetical protein [Candidatus Berkelbacteria bacterium]
MIIKYGDGWIKFPDVVWEPSGFDATGEQLWTSRPVTAEDTRQRKALGDDLIETKV